MECASSYDDSIRSCRLKKKQTEPFSCPICGLTIRGSETEAHVVTEIEKLVKLAPNKPKQNARGEERPSTSQFQSYQRVRGNRQNRQKLKTRKRRTEETVCPICNQETSEDITMHVEMCLEQTEAQNRDQNDESVDVDVEGFEEYEWAGHSRVRATTLLEGGVESLGLSLTRTDEDEDLVVDGDDTPVYGSPQYTERDVVIPGDDKEQEAVRKVMLGGESVQLAGNKAKRKSKAGNEVLADDACEGDPIVEALKSRIRELERRLQKDEVCKCLICMDRYQNPVVSVRCWHVHCETCWMQTLGAKKLCPECNMITSPSDLRKIYM